MEGASLQGARILVHRVQANQETRLQVSRHDHRWSWHQRWPELHRHWQLWRPLSWLSASRWRGPGGSGQGGTGRQHSWPLKIKARPSDLLLNAHRGARRAGQRRWCASVASKGSKASLSKGISLARGQRSRRAPAQQAGARAAGPGWI